MSFITTYAVVSYVRAKKIKGEGSYKRLDLNSFERIFRHVCSVVMVVCLSAGLAVAKWVVGLTKLSSEPLSGGDCQKCESNGKHGISIRRSVYNAHQSKSKRQQERSKEEQ